MLLSLKAMLWTKVFTAVPIIHSRLTTTQRRPLAHALPAPNGTLQRPYRERPPSHRQSETSTLWAAVGACFSWSLLRLQQHPTEMHSVRTKQVTCRRERSADERRARATSCLLEACGGELRRLGPSYDLQILKSPPRRASRPTHILNPTRSGSEMVNSSSPLSAAGTASWLHRTISTQIRPAAKGRPSGLRF